MVLFPLLMNFFSLGGDGMAGGGGGLVLGFLGLSLCTNPFVLGGEGGLYTTLPLYFCMASSSA